MPIFAGNALYSILPISSIGDFERRLRPIGIDNRIGIDKTVRRSLGDGKDGNAILAIASSLSRVPLWADDWFNAAAREGNGGPESKQKRA